MTHRAAILLPHRRNMGVGQYSFVFGYDRDIHFSGGCDDDTVRRVIVKFARQIHGLNGNGGVYWYKMKKGESLRGEYPLLNIHGQLESTLFDQHGDFPGADGRNIDLLNFYSAVDFISGSMG